MTITRSRPAVIGAAESATGDNADPQDLEVLLADKARIGRTRARARRRIRKVGSAAKPCGLANRDERKLSSVGSGCDRGQRSEPSDEVVGKHLQLRTGREIGKTHLERQDVLRVVAGFYRRQFREAVDEQAAAHEEHHRESDLRDDQQPTHRCARRRHQSLLERVCDP